MKLVVNPLLFKWFVIFTFQEIFHSTLFFIDKVILSCLIYISCVDQLLLIIQEVKT